MRAAKAALFLCPSCRFFITVVMIIKKIKEQQMEYMEFLESVCEYINEKTDDVRVSVHKTIKNNGVRLCGLTFNRQGYNASPTVYMENYFDEYLNGGDLCEIGDRLLAAYYENDMAVKLNISFFDSFESVKDRIYIKLINRAKNEDYLKGAPFEEFLDLAIVPYVRVYDKKIGNGLIMVKNEHLKLWNVSASAVLEEAKRNTHDHDGFNIRQIMDVLKSMKVPGIPDDPYDRFPMYVATNSKMTNGAAVLTMKDKLKEFATVIGGDYYIIPSSVHEVILVPNNDDRSADEIDSMIREVNSTQLGPDDVLADHVYLYHKKDEVLIF